MSRAKVEKLGSLFLAVFSVGLSAVLYADGFEPKQWFGATLAIAASLVLAITVRVWPKPEPIRVRADRD
jgi:hypothetical protein